MPGQPAISPHVVPCTMPPRSGNRHDENPCALNREAAIVSGDCRSRSLHMRKDGVLRQVHRPCGKIDLHRPAADLQFARGDDSEIMPGLRSRQPRQRQRRGEACTSARNQSLGLAVSAHAWLDGTTDLQAATRVTPLASSKQESPAFPPAERSKKALRPLRRAPWQCRRSDGHLCPSSSLKVSKMPNLSGPSLTAYQVLVPGSCAASGCADFRNSSTSFSFPGLALSNASKANLSIMTSRS